jgi:plasmid segregation protein ParM
MNIGIDIGYAAIKAITDGRCATFPSAVGTPDKASFSINGTSGIILEAPHNVSVGQEAVTQSRFLQRREDRGWIESTEWYALFLAALTELTTASRVDVGLVTGLPVAFYGDKPKVQAVLLGEHVVKREDRGTQRFVVNSARVVPQPFGALLCECLDKRGIITDHDIANGQVGVIDVGGKTTNLLAVRKLSEVARDTASVNLGAWDAVRSLRSWMAREYPDLDLRDHEIAQMVRERKVRYYDEVYELGDVVDEILEPMAAQVLAEATQLWNGGARLQGILVTGGGALLLGPYIRRHFRHARVVDDPVFANARGFWKFSRRVGG